LSSKPSIVSIQDLYLLACPRPPEEVWKKKKTNIIKQKKEKEIKIIIKRKLEERKKGD